MPSIRNMMLSLFCAALLGHAAMLPPSFIDSVVAIGHNEQAPGGPATWITEASGFFYGYLVQEDPDPTKRRYEIYLITNRHVIQNHAVIFFRLNPKQQSDQGQVFDVPMIDQRGIPAWFTHKDPTVDIAAAQINWQLLQ